MAKELPPIDFLHKIFQCDPASGSLTWKERPLSQFKSAHGMNSWNSKYAGTDAGWMSSNGYRQTSICRNKFLIHRIIWKMATGVEPEYIDHVNGDRGDNRICNLRSVSAEGNARNSAKQKNNKSGHPGVFFNRNRQYWEVCIYNKNKKISVGYFDTKDEAIEAREAAEADLGYHPNHGR